MKNHTATPFGPIGSDVYRRTYSRPLSEGGHESWPDTVRRVISGNAVLDKYVTEDERRYSESLMDNFSMLPAGRHLWVTGIPGIPGEARRNCWRSPHTNRLADHIEFLGSMLLLGGGVGANYSREYLDQSAPIRPITLSITCDPTHKDYDAVVAAAGETIVENWGASFTVEDSREGWVATWGHLMDAATSYGTAQSVTIDVSKVRAAGEPILTFGGTASGPGPLVSSLVGIYGVLRGAVGRRLTGVESMLCDHAVASAVVAGGARRSARMSIMHWNDPEIFEFINCKADHMHHWTTNISVEVDDAFLDAYENCEAHALNVMDAVVRGMYLNGEPGLYNSSLASVGEHSDVRCTNPCVTGDTLVMTQDGLARADSLLGKKVSVRVNGENHWTTDEGFFQTGVKPVLHIDVDGTTLSVTEDHPVLTSDGWVPAGCLSVGDSLVLGEGSDAWQGSGGSYEDGYTVGHLIGDGTFSDDKPRLESWGDDQPVRDYLARITGSTWREGADKFSMAISRDLPSRYGVFRRDKKMTDQIMSSSSEFSRGLLAALFDTDGHVEGASRKGGVSIRLSQSDEAFLGRVKILLQAHGIRSVVRDMKDAGLVQFHADQKYYQTRDSFRLVISGSHVETFLNRIGFKNPVKQKKAESLVAEMTRGFYTKGNVSSIRSITLSETDLPVYDCQVPGINAFEANGIVVSNCGEVPLQEGESCNIGSVDLAVFGTDHDGALGAFRQLTRFLLRQTLTEMKTEISREVESKNRRLGAGFLGLQGWAAAHGVKYSEIPKNDLLLRKLREFRMVCRDEANQYADELGIPRPIKVTAVAPNGTTAQLRGTQPGAHALLARHCVRNVRYTTGDPRISEALDRGLTVEPCIYAEHTFVVSYPLADQLVEQYPIELIEEISEVSIYDQFAVLAAVTEAFCGGSDGNGVSFTASFDPATVTLGELSEAVVAWLPYTKGLTVFPTASRPQSPYIPISVAEYDRLIAGGAWHEGSTGIDDLQACAGGACPIR